MNRAASLSLLLAFVAVPVMADNSRFSAVVRDTVTREIHERKEAKESEQSPDELRRAANVGARSNRTPFGFYLVNQDDSLNVASCPMDVEGSPAYDSLRNHFREFTDDEMWKICLNRNSAPSMGAFPSACACSLLAHPSPWRPVAVPDASERDEAFPMEDPELEEVPIPAPQTTAGS
jgi:hypothetical protein